MLAILLVAVGIVIYWIFMYDTWYPNEHSHIIIPESDDSRSEGLGVGTE